MMQARAAPSCSACRLERDLACALAWCSTLTCCSSTAHDAGNGPFLLCASPSRPWFALCFGVVCRANATLRCPALSATKQQMFQSSPPPDLLEREGTVVFKFTMSRKRPRHCSFTFYRSDAVATRVANYLAGCCMARSPQRFSRIVLHSFFFSGWCWVCTAGALGGGVYSMMLRRGLPTR